MGFSLDRELFDVESTADSDHYRGGGQPLREPIWGRDAVGAALPRGSNGASP